MLDRRLTSDVDDSLLESNAKTRTAKNSGQISLVDTADLTEVVEPDAEEALARKVSIGNVVAECIQETRPICCKVPLDAPLLLFLVVNRSDEAVASTIPRRTTLMERATTRSPALTRGEAVQGADKTFV